MLDEEQPALRFQDSAHLRQRARGVRDRAQDERADHVVEALVLERKLLGARAKHARGDATTAQLALEQARHRLLRLGDDEFSGKASCVLVGNVGTITGGIKLFPKASPIDGKLELAVVTAGSEIEWARVFACVATGHASRSPFVRTTRATRISVKMKTTEPYELDGGDREPTKALKFSVETRAIAVCVPASMTAARSAPRNGLRREKKLESKPVPEAASE